MKRTFLAGCITLLSSVLCCSAFAEGWEVGWMGAATQTQLADKDGPHQTVSESSWLNFLLVSPRDRDNRFLTQFYSSHFDTQASTSNIGTTTNRSGVNLSYQWLLRVSRDWKPWVGLGAGYAREAHTSRHTVRSDGYLGQTYPDLSPSGLAVLANATSEWSVADQWRVGLHLQYELPLGKTSTVTTLGIFVLYELK